MSDEDRSADGRVAEIRRETLELTEGSGGRLSRRRLRRTELLLDRMTTVIDEHGDDMSPTSKESLRDATTRVARMLLESTNRIGRFRGARIRRLTGRALTQTRRRGLMRTGTSARRPRVSSR